MCSKLYQILNNVPMPGQRRFPPFFLSLIPFKTRSPTSSINLLLVLNYPNLSSGQPPVIIPLLLVVSRLRKSFYFFLEFSPRQYVYLISLPIMTLLWIKLPADIFAVPPDLNYKLTNFPFIYTERPRCSYLKKYP